ncbi:urease accessory protein UreD [Catellatospora sp. KI3]|uniref:urease accessory protein UreD n=1 Tax=Catellatospora sp. KI3 TaxID=3041620 RepID=UPI002482A4C5|nr:urease accessory protein UreD [Catellatospora sp. KI3]MDI1461341.1 urease accessory protein UreD [Catellatospora sp. KI3]
MRALARVTAVADGRGGTRLAQVRGEPPLILRHTPTPTGPAVVYLVGAAAGPLAGDDLRMEIEVGEGAELRLHSVAASVALPSRVAAASRLSVTVTVAAEGSLEWLPEQLVAARGCDHVSASAIELAEGARLMWREELICGRHDEAPGDVVIETSVRYAGRPLLRQSTAVGPASVGWDGPAVLGGAKAVGSLLRVRPGRPQAAGRVIGPTAVRMPLTTGPADLVSATAQDAHVLRRLLDE